MKLGVNIDHVATLRQARGGQEPDPLNAAKICQAAGAHAIVMHLREDRRHVQDADVFAVKKAIRIKFNLEMSIATSVVKVAFKLKPDQVTLVPEKRQERTTEGGIDLFYQTAKIEKLTREFNAKKIHTSLFIDPDPKQIEKSYEIGAEAVEFHTGYYANQTTRAAAARELKKLKRAVRVAGDLGLRVYAGHGLNYANVAAIRKITAIEELNIGHSIVTQAVWAGLGDATRQMLRLIR